MVTLRRVYESEEYYPLDTKKAKSLSRPPKGWIVLDLSGLDTTGSGLKSGKNDGVFINKSDYDSFIDSKEDIINPKTIVGHSYGVSFDNSLTYRSLDDKGNSKVVKRVAIPKVFVSKLKSYRYLSEVDPYAGLGLVDWKVYTTSFRGFRSIEIPKSAYERRSTQQYAEYESSYQSLRDLPKMEMITRKKESKITGEQALSLLKMFYKEPKWKSFDKPIVKEIKNKLEDALDKDFVSSIDELKEELKESDLDVSVFVKNPDIKVYDYTFNIYTIKDYKDFVNLLSGVPKVPDTINNPNTNRISGVKYFIIDTREKAPHTIGSLQRDHGLVYEDGVYKEDGKPHKITWSGDRIIDVEQ